MGMKRQRTPCRSCGGAGPFHARRSYVCGACAKAGVRWCGLGSHLMGPNDALPHRSRCRACSTARVRRHRGSPDRLPCGACLTSKPPSAFSAFHGNVCRDCRASGIAWCCGVRGIMGGHITHLLFCGKARGRCLWCQSRGGWAGRIKRVYGVDPQWVEKRLAEQMGRCAICETRLKSPREICVDHDHVSGVARAVLCPRCNSALGYLLDDACIASAAANYLRSWSHLRGETPADRLVMRLERCG